MAHRKKIGLYCFAFITVIVPSLATIWSDVADCTAKRKIKDWGWRLYSTNDVILVTSKLLIKIPFSIC